MTSLKTDGFGVLVTGVADLARKQPTVADAARVACTLDGRITEKSGLAALSRPERGLLERLGRAGAVLGTGGGDWSLWLTRTGRLRVGPGVPGGDDGAHLIGTARWPARAAGSRQCAERLWAQEVEAERSGFLRLAADLAREPAPAVRERLDLICYALIHMAPVRIYVGDRTYSNLGPGCNLPGRSLGPGAAESVLTRLQDQPVARWRAEEAVFVACAAALIRSGAPVRLEEFNGSQLTPVTLENWLAERARCYGGCFTGPEITATLGRLEALARHCAQRRGALVNDGVQFYRAIEGVSLHKEERMQAAPVTSADIPPRAAAFLRDTAGLELGGGGATVAPGGLPELAAVLAGPAGDERFGTAFEQFLHGLLAEVAEDTAADVAMARGPRYLAGLASGAMPPERVLKLATSENYCCVVPSQAFVRRFAQDRESLVKAIAAYSARMRYNTWHYLPDGLGLGDRRPGRDDWFFAPSMPDITTWSDQHHTGHVAFGVRYAIRIPIGVTFDGAFRPGLYDLRLMRAGEPPFTLGHLRAGIAVSKVLGGVHQAMAAHEHRVSAFDNSWFRGFHG